MTTQKDVQDGLDAMTDSEFIQMNIDNMNEQFEAEGPVVVDEMRPLVARFEEIRDRLRQEDGR